MKGDYELKRVETIYNDIYSITDNEVISIKSSSKHNGVIVRMEAECYVSIISVMHEEVRRQNPSLKSKTEIIDLILPLHSIKQEVLKNLIDLEG